MRQKLQLSLSLVCLLNSLY